MQRELEEQNRTELAELDAGKLRLDNPAGRVRYEDILLDPDNIDLNYRYAETQVAEGNLLGAAATLERILLVNPDLHRVRLFYALVLYRLDNWTEAARELEVLMKQDLPPDVRQETGAYIKKIRSRMRSTHFSLSQSAGLALDSNRNAAPSSKKRIFADALFDASAQDRRRSDTSFLNITQAGVSHELGFQAGHELFANFVHYQQEQTEVDSLDLRSFQYDLGGVYKTPWFHFIPSFYAGNIFLSRETFLRTQGGSFGLTRSFADRWTAFSQTRIERQNYSGISENPSGSERSGRYVELENGLEAALNRAVRLSASFVYGNKSAKEDFNAYERLIVRSNLSVVLPRGHFVLNSFDLGRDIYDEPEIAVASRIRRENTLRYRATYGSSLDGLLIGRLLPKGLGDITLTVSYEYFRALANITNYTYHNNKFQFLLTKRWEF